MALETLRPMEYVFRALWFASLLVIAARLLNRATLVSKKPYTFAVNVTFGTVAGHAILMGDHPVWEGSAAIAALTFFAWATDALAARFPRVHTVLAGKPVPLVRSGQPIRASMEQLRTTESDLRMHLRHLRIASVSDVEFAEMEPDGKIGVVLREDVRDGL